MNTPTISNYDREMYDKYREVVDFILARLPDDDAYSDRGSTIFEVGQIFFGDVERLVFGRLLAETQRRAQYEALKAEFG